MFTYSYVIILLFRSDYFGGLAVYIHGSFHKIIRVCFLKFRSHGRIIGHERKSGIIFLKKAKQDKKAKNAQKYVQKVGKYFTTFEKGTLICATITSMKGNIPWQ